MSRPPVGRHISIDSAAMEWIDPTGGRWEITAHWSSTAGGPPKLVGLDIRSFRARVELSGGIALTRHYALGDDEPAELTQRAVRSVPISTVRETTRADILSEAQQYSTPDGVRQSSLPQLDDGGAFIARHFAEKAAAYTAKGEPRKRLPAAGAADLEVVARLYLAAVQSGDKTPARTLEAELRAAGWPINPPPHGRDQVRKYIQRARERDLIPPVK